MRWRSLLGFAGCPPSLSPCLRVIPHLLVPQPRPLCLRCLCPCVCLVAWAVESGRGRCLAVRVQWQVFRGPLCGCDPLWLARCWFWAAVACRGGRVPRRCSVTCPGVPVPVPVSPGGLVVLTGCGRVGRCRSLRRGVSLLRPSWRPPPSVSLPCPAPSVGSPPVIPCPRVVLPAVSCSRGCVPVTWGLSPPSCRGPSLCPFPSRCPGAGVVARYVGRRWTIPGGGLSGAIGGGFRGCKMGRSL